MAYVCQSVLQRKNKCQIDPHFLANPLNMIYHCSIVPPSVLGYPMVQCDHVISFETIKGLNSSKPANTPLTSDDYAKLKKEQKIIMEAKKKVFGPLKERLIKKYGKHVQSYMLSNRVIQELALGQTKFPSYRLEVFRQLSGEYSSEIEYYLG